ncbi:MAG TPA: efflux RND transporter periplasmic adaptor subunit [Burkholderiales bacterium]|jgi:HlyD family secretion protein
MQKLRRWVLILLLAAVIAAAVWYFTRPKPVEVTLAKVDRGLVERTVANTRAATVTACRRAKLAPQAGGQIARLLVREGDRVTKNQVLLELWSEDLRAQVRLAEDQLSAARARADQACLSAELAQREADRAQQLREERFISADALDKAVSQARAQRAACTAARADVEQARAGIQVAQASLSRQRLRAPFDGIVAEVTGELGEFTTPSPPGIPTPPAIDLIDDSCLYVTAPIDEVDAPAIKLKMPARISVDAFPGRKFPAHVRRIAPYVLDVEKQARTVDVEVEFNDPKETGVLLVGYSADVEVVLDSRDDVLRVPTAAIQEGSRVLLYRPDGRRLEERRIQSGLSNWEYTEVTSGLSAGDQVVLSLERKGVAPGAKVVPEQAH